MDHLKNVIYSSFEKLRCHCSHYDRNSLKYLSKNIDRSSLLLDIVQATYEILLNCNHCVREIWNWSSFIQLLRHQEPDIRWFAVHCISQVIQMGNVATESLIKKCLTFEEEQNMIVRYAFNHAMLGNLDVFTRKQLQDVLLDTDSDFELDLKNLGSSFDDSDILVCVPSTQRNLNNLAVAVSVGNPVLLQGPVGCGKTTLVEQLAKKVNRDKTPSLMKVQLGDQMDSKTLLGTYHCTNIPGEFIWKPGLLTKAVTEGHFVLLEDIDTAPLDVISVLIPLLESGSLHIPGHSSSIKVSAGFRLFATQRLLKTASGFFHQQTNNATLLDKLWTKITVESLSRKELHQIIITKYPKLAEIVDRLLDIYFLLSSGHDQEDSSQELVNSLSTERPISTRDLVKWCHRLAQFQGTEDILKIFHESLDCFCAAIKNSSFRLKVAEVISAKLNIVATKVEYFYTIYKPNIQFTSEFLRIGRDSLIKKKYETAFLEKSSPVKFAFTRPVCVLLESLIVCINNFEPVLLVGETGTGKTSMVQYLAEKTGHCMHVINMNQQSDSVDLLGGFKPVDIRMLVSPVREEFENVFYQTFSRKENMQFISHVQQCFTKRKWRLLLQLMNHSCKAAIKKLQSNNSKDKSYIKPLELLAKWQAIDQKLNDLKLQMKHAENMLAFSFIEGTLVKAVRRGDWILLDEINLASAETLECLSGLLESSSGSVVLLERGDLEPVRRHKDFQIFACMNPATDVGKKDLPLGIRNRFTEFFIDELEDRPNLELIVDTYLSPLGVTPKQIKGIISFYLKVRSEAGRRLADSSGSRPHYSLRTLCRALQYASGNPYGAVIRSLYEAFCLSFLTQLDQASHPAVEHLIVQHLFGTKDISHIVKQIPGKPLKGEFCLIEGHWIPQGELEPNIPDNYILTRTVTLNLKDLARIVAAGRFPVLLQGCTSVGKTSLIKWLAEASGNRVVRVNNHEHTDLQEYLGCYAADKNGKLVFTEGVLVEAMRKGYWIILDELNLAPTDILEALNRVLDDNRELFIPETQQVVKAHPRFMLFATQNPPGLYGGRKILSRAFRNRFVELHFDEIPPVELETILHKRCSLPMSYSKKLVAVMRELQIRRSSSGVFAGKQGYITLRDLFRWGERYHLAVEPQVKFYDWDQHIANEGYMLLAGRVRKDDEVLVILEVLEKHLNRKVNPLELFSTSSELHLSPEKSFKFQDGSSLVGFEHMVWTYNIRRLGVLLSQAFKFKEPVLLVGETGCGKTTLCQMFAQLKDQEFYCVNCHLHTETSDFLGGLRPVRHRNESDKDDKERGLFEWCDGPLVLAMKKGALFLVDEISLAEDSVLERLNSILEPERALLLAEKGNGDGDQNKIDYITAHPDFQIVATMNPSGDFGKKELSPALRNRFTEIWCPQMSNASDVLSIIDHNINPKIFLGENKSGVGHAMVNFIEWLKNNNVTRRLTISIRDILSWCHFINTCASMFQVNDCDKFSSTFDASLAYIHGACLVFLDAMGSGPTASDDRFIRSAYQQCCEYLIQQISTLANIYLDDKVFKITANVEYEVIKDNEPKFGIDPFFISRGPLPLPENISYEFGASTTHLNLMRVLRAMQLSRPILLEGSPGVGKTSLILALAKSAGHHLVRINLSEQTDIADLFGTDLPVENSPGGHFAWKDGPLLQALKMGHWIIFDELNLASQSVLEGLNACLDHRGEIYIPELGRSFYIQHDKTKIFACQNPLHQGGGRKGLPRSFLNRFTQVYVDTMTSDDLVFITSSLYPSIPKHLIIKMIEFNSEVHFRTSIRKIWIQKGGPWEYNLRDVFRWCDLMLFSQNCDSLNPGDYFYLIYVSRLRSLQDQTEMMDLYSTYFGPEYPIYKPNRCLSVTSNYVQIGQSCLPREDVAAVQCDYDLSLLHHNLEYLEGLLKCLQMNWMCLLIGGTASGKSSLVHIASALVGHKVITLHMNSTMDTSELLGSYEQADVKYHLEELIQFFTNSVTLVSKEFVIYEKFPKEASLISDLLNIKTELMSLFVSGSEDIKKLLSYFEVGIKILQVLNINCEQIISGIEKLTGKFKIVSTGQFEWIDSILVKALQNGSWLVVENANFCSASVLDRLNALLEPGGVLSIHERGIIDGNVLNVSPHPDFRLILLMDPKHGEISRAMRNRGVEIYLFGEYDGVPYDVFDVKTLLIRNGINLPPVYSYLIDLHHKLREVLTSSDRPAITDLLHVGKQISLWLSKGCSLKTALNVACTNIYVLNRRNTENRKNARNVIDETLNSFLTEDICNFKISEVGLWPNSLPAVKEVALNTNVSNIKRDGVMLSYLLMPLISENFEVPSVEICDRIIPSKDQSLLSSRSFALLEFIELSSFNDHGLRNCWLEYFLQEHCSVAEHLTAKSLLVHVQGVFDKLFSPEALDVSKSVLAVCSREALSQPADLRWNSQLFKKLIKIYSLQHPEWPEQLISFSNRFSLCLLYWFHRGQENQLQIERGSFLDQALRFCNGSLIAEELDHAVVVYLKSFFEQFDQLIDHLFKDVKIVSNDLLIQLYDGLKWRFRLWMVCTRKEVAASKKFAVLRMHWQWFLKYLQPLFSHFTSFQIDSIVQDISKQLPYTKAPLKVWKSFGYPQPYTTRLAFLCMTRLMKLSQRLWRHPKNGRYHISEEYFTVRSSVYEALMRLEEEKSLPFISSEYEDDILALVIRNEHLCESKLSSQTPGGLDLLEICDIFQIIYTRQVLGEILYDKNSPTKSSVTFDLALSNSPLDAIVKLNKAMCNSDNNSCEALLLHQYYLWTRLEAHNVSDGTEKIEPPLLKGPHLLYTPLLSHHIMKTLDKFMIWTGVSLVQVILLSQLKHHVQQLSLLRTVLWYNHPVISKSFGEQMIAKKVFVHLLQAMTSQSSVDIVFLLTCLPRDLPKEIINLITECCDRIGNEDSTSNLGHIWVYLGLLHLILLSPKKAIDPIEKKNVKLNHLKTELVEVEEEIVIRNWKFKVLTGLEFFNQSASDCHPRIPYLLSKAKQLPCDINKLEKNLAVRPSISQYEAILSDIEHYQKTIASSRTVKTLLNDLAQARESSIHVFLQEKTWQDAQFNFVSKMLTDYPMYKDIVVPFLAGACQISYGMRLLAYTAFQRKCVLSKDHNNLNLSNLIMLLAKSSFSESSESVASQLVSILEKFSIWSQANINPEMIRNAKYTLRLLTIALLNCQNHLHTQRSFCDESATIINIICDKTAQVWYACEKERIKKEEEAGALYEYKVQVHAEEPTDEEKEEMLLEQLFPSFDESFSDLIATPLETDAKKKVSSKRTKMNVLTFKDVAFLQTTFQSLYLNFSSYWWLPQNNPPPVETCHYLNTISTGYQMATDIIKHSVIDLDRTLDEHLIGSHLIIIASLQNIISKTDKISELSVPNSSPFDIYHDACVDESIQCYSVLTELNTRVKELLGEWPDNPILVQILHVIKRIFSFSITDSLMKFVSGLELLLAKAQDWEACAHKGVSLRTHLEIITSLVLQWRKLELNCWRLCLDTVENKVSNEASKWWFHLHAVFASSLHDSSSQPVISEDILKTIHQFMETSPIGEYDARLKMLFAYHIKLARIEGSQSELFRNILWNCYNYYCQFSPNIKKQIESKKLPLEKYLKEFVKISRWNDINFFAMKQAVTKSHRVLASHTRKYEKILKEAAQLSFAGEESQPKDDKTVLVEKKLYLSSDLLKDSTSSELSIISGDAPTNIIHRLSHLFSKMKKFCNRIMESSQFFIQSQNVNEFAGEVISTLLYYQNLNPAEKSDKDKIKSEVKNIQMRKRKALADLFKELLVIGLSFHKGLTLSWDRNLHNALLENPVDMPAGLKHVPSLLMDSEMITLWDGCLDYFYKCISRAAVLKRALLNPAKDLGPNNAERCHGFSLSLFYLTIKQRKWLSTIAEPFLKLRFLATSINKLCICTEQLPQELCCQHLIALKNSLSRAAEVLHHFLLLLYSCPDKSTTIPLESCLLPTAMKAPAAQFFRGHEVWNKAVSDVKNMLQKIQRILQHSIFKTTILGNLSLFTMSEFNILESFFEDLDSCKSFLLELIALFKMSDEKQVTIILPLETLEKDIAVKIQNFYSFSNAIKVPQTVSGSETGKFTDQVFSFQKLVDGLLEKMLCDVQALYKTIHVKGNEKEDSEILFTNCFSQVMNTSLRSTFNSFHVKEVVSHLLELQEIFLHMEREVAHECQPLLLLVQPVLTQYLYLLQYNMTALVACHRSSCKLLYVLLGLFTELAQKGFCLPPEMSDEFEPGTELEGLEDAGLGEGEGTKDVSEQIEEEAQLEGLAGEKEDDDDKAHSDEEQGIEMSENFDGKMNDMDKDEGSEASNSEESEEEEELDKEMGDVDDAEEKLDEQIWGSDSDEDDSEMKDDEFGPGGGKESESQLVAKDDKQDQTKSDKDLNQTEDTKLPENEDESEYTGEHPDPIEEDKPNDDTNDLDLPDDLELDKNEEADAGEENELQKEDELPEEVPEETNDLENVEQEEDKETSEGAVEEEPAEAEEESTEEKKVPDNTNITVKDMPQEEDLNDKNNPDSQDRNPTVDTSAQTTQSDIANIPQVQKENESRQQTEDCAGQPMTEDNVKGLQGTEVRDEKPKTQPEESQQHSKRPRPASDSSRTLGNLEEKVHKRLKIADDDLTDEPNTEKKKVPAEWYKHEGEDTQVMDAATEEQMELQPHADISEGSEVGDDDNVDDIQPMEDEKEESSTTSKSLAAQTIKDQKKDKDELEQGKEGELTKMDTEGENVLTESASRNRDSTIHTQTELVDMDLGLHCLQEDDVRLELEKDIQLFRSVEEATPEQIQQAQEIWLKCDAVTASLSQELCEQLRLILEPSEAAKLKGDYRTGKRLNMRKIIPYLASQFRKDKIWLRRTKPSKRHFQIILAVDDSSSMADNRSKQLTFESLAVISSAMTRLEVGEFGICSFGENVRLLHHLQEPFNSDCGAKVIQQFTFCQSKTRIAQLLSQMTSVFLAARPRLGSKSADVSQLLIIISDGRGLYNEGVDLVKQSVRRIREASVFTVFVIIDSPDSKNSILDIRVPVFKSNGQLFEIRHYLDDFPFPFYIILKDVAALPAILSNALRQWFELITRVDT